MKTVFILLLFFFYSFSFAAEKDSTLVDSLLLRGDILIASGDVKNAKKSYKKALKYEKNSPLALSALGKIAFTEKDWGDVKGYFDKILKTDADNLGKLDWNKSKKHFLAVISSDSLYQDVLYQYAQLLRYREQYEEAIRTNHAQVWLRPDLLEPQVKIFRLYRYLITHRSNEEAMDWLKEQPWDHAKHFICEALRREGKLQEADSIFQILVTDSLNMPVQPLYLSMARVYYQKEDPQTAQDYYWKGIDEIQNEVSADLELEDIKYILTDEELESYHSLQTIEDKKEFFKSFWILRNPTPAATVNVRLAEHYRRMLYAEENYEYDGFRTWFQDPDELNYLQYPNTNELNHEFNDKGLIYIRHGEPDDRAFTIGDDIPINESWMYYQRGDMPQMDFHFYIGTTGNDWRFTPIISHPAILADRLGWGNIYYDLYRASPLEQLQYENQMAERSRKNVTEGLTTDRHKWAENIKPLDVPTSFDTFRGSDGKTILEMSYAIPIKKLFDERENQVIKDSLEVETGFAIYDQKLHEKAKAQTVLEIPDQNFDIFVNMYRYQIPPDSYHVAFHVRPLESDYLGGFRLKLPVEDYSKPELEISDIQLASNIEPATEKSFFVKNGLMVVPNPTHHFSLNNLIYLYFEIYNLSRDESGKSIFTIEYTLERVKKKKKFLGLFGGGDRPSVTFNAVREGNSEVSIEYYAIDISKADPGEYILTVHISDNLRSTVAERTRKIKIVE
jgi:GWxTD domain-containing protein